MYVSKLTNLVNKYLYRKIERFVIFHRVVITDHSMRKKMKKNKRYVKSSIYWKSNGHNNRTKYVYVNLKKIPNKYYVIKALKPDYLILCTCKKCELGLTSYGVDALLLKYINEKCFKRVNTSRKSLYAKLTKLNINFLILDGLEEKFIHTFDKNNYGSYIYTSIFDYLI